MSAIANTAPVPEALFECISESKMSQAVCLLYTYHEVTVANPGESILHPGTSPVEAEEDRHRRRHMDAPSPYVVNDREGKQHYADE